ncbi:hypothetical protein GCM10009727_12560 [Actinomadura napierensis]|uniref:Uncharacterized protein n=1 Tax=Actinomadura napierensis TaxID=267854 RepID=A0ABP5JZ06_9ACTN
MPSPAAACRYVSEPPSRQRADTGCWRSCGFFPCRRDAAALSVLSFVPDLVVPAAPSTRTLLVLSCLSAGAETDLSVPGRLGGAEPELRGRHGGTTHTGVKSSDSTPWNKGHITP